MFSLSCCLSAAAIRFLAVLSRHGSPPSLRLAYRCLVNPPDRDGVSMFRTGESRLVSGAPYTPGPWCSHGRHRNFGHHCRLSTAGPVPRCHFPSPKFWVTRLAGVHAIRPSSLPLACNRWMEHQSLGFLPGFTPRRCQRRMPGAGTSVEHSLGANRRYPTLHFSYLTQPVRPHVAPRFPSVGEHACAPRRVSRPGRW
jgi:hypothetical protein